MKHIQLRAVNFQRQFIERQAKLGACYLTLLNLSSGALILVMIVLANIYQRRTMRKFSGVIGKVMLWYSLGLAALLVLTIFQWVVNLVELSPFIGEYGTRGFFVVAVAFFLQGARVIR